MTIPFSGYWDSNQATSGVTYDGITMTRLDDGTTQVHATIRPVGPITVRYSKTLIAFDARMGDGPVRAFRIWYPVTDRRLARRIARREGKRFRKRGKEYVFR